MSVISSTVDQILTLHGPPAYALVGALVFAEAALFVGFVLPGETAVVLGGVLAERHSVSLTLVIIVAVASAIIGDSIGYEVGRHFGPRLLGLKVFDRHRDALEKGQAALKRNGGRAVFLGRFTAFLRAVMPGLAGTSKMAYRRFLAFNALGGLVWAIGFTMLGYLAGASYQKVQKVAGTASEVLLGLVILLVVVLVIRRRRAERSSESSPTPPDD
ncbi:MAG: rane-associated protein [Frankiales bacterium]|jgi:membrane protein DedA with SNARE-associated domain|nr:rane-associated protein [Frankiales bacterium]